MSSVDFKRCYIGVRSIDWSALHAALSPFLIVLAFIWYVFITLYTPCSLFRAIVMGIYFPGRQSRMSNFSCGCSMFGLCNYVISVVYVFRLCYNWKVLLNWSTLQQYVGGDSFRMISDTAESFASGR